MSWLDDATQQKRQGEEQQHEARERQVLEYRQACAQALENARSVAAMISANLSDLGKATWHEEAFELWGELRPEDEELWRSVSESRLSTYSLSVPSLRFAAFKKSGRRKDGYLVTLIFHKDGRPGALAVGDTSGGAVSITTVSPNENDLRGALTTQFQAGPRNITYALDHGRIH